jgi:hypothetical protein
VSQDQFEDLNDRMDALHARISRNYRDLFRLIAQADRDGVWEDSGARDMPQWLAMRYDMSWWKANRWITAAHALDGLPHVSDALAAGEIGVDKAVELAQFATIETEERLLVWARRVSYGAVRRKAELLARRSLDDARVAERDRFLSWWFFDEGRRFRLEGELPAADGSAVARALERLAEKVPTLPGEEEPCHVEARRADALVALASARLAAHPDADRATVVVHASPETLAGNSGGCEIEGGGVVHPATARRLACTARVQMIVEDEEGQVVGLGRTSREPSAWMMRQLRHRDDGCRFPGCGTRSFIKAHHIVWWEWGGRTDLDNLILVCTFHHKLVHEHGWSIRRFGDGGISWLRPDGRPHVPGPAPPKQAVRCRLGVELDDQTLVDLDRQWDVAAVGQA